MEICTAGFAGWGAREFFEALTQAEVGLVVDTRLRNHSQLAGFAKRDDLAYFLEVIAGVGYVHELRLAPTEDLLKAYRDGKMSWDQYEQAYRALLVERRVEDVLPRSTYPERILLLCSEHEPEHCHRRVAAEYLSEHWLGVSIEHLQLGAA